MPEACTAVGVRSLMQVNGAAGGFPWRRHRLPGEAVASPLAVAAVAQQGQ
jgi:hypothetical protein